jgi:transposase
MGAPRRVIALPSDAKQRQRLVEISRSRTEPTSRVERARIILAYLEDPSAYAVARTIGVTQQTVTRCLERAAELGVIEALDDRPRAGRDPVITAEAKTWRVALACRKAKELGYPHELWTARLLAAHARQHGPSAGRSSRSTIAARTWVSRSIGAASRTLEDVRLSVHGAPLSLDAEWLPAVEQFGEGLFIHFNEAAVRTWLEQEPVNTRAAQLLAGFDLWERQHQTHLDYPGAAYTMLHGLSHALMAEIALECGYPASALKERVYALSGHAGPARPGAMVF